MRCKNCFSLTYTWPDFFSDVFPFVQHKSLWCILYNRVPLLSLLLLLFSPLCLSFSSSRFLHFSGGGGRSTAALHHWCEGRRISLRQRFIALHFPQMNSLQKHSIWCLWTDELQLEKKRETTALKGLVLHMFAKWSILLTSRSIDISNVPL